MFTNAAVKRIHMFRMGSIRHYNTLFERQTNFPIVNMDTTAILSVLESLGLDHSLPATLALV